MSLPKTSQKIHSYPIVNDIGEHINFISSSKNGVGSLIWNPIRGIITTYINIVMYVILTTLQLILGEQKYKSLDDVLLDILSDLENAVPSITEPSDQLYSDVRLYVLSAISGVNEHSDDLPQTVWLAIERRFHDTVHAVWSFLKKQRIVVGILNLVHYIVAKIEKFLDYLFPYHPPTAPATSVNEKVNRILNLLHIHTMKTVREYQGKPVVDGDSMSFKDFMAYIEAQLKKLYNNLAKRDASNVFAYLLQQYILMQLKIAITMWSFLSTILPVFYAAIKNMFTVNSYFLHMFVTIWHFIVSATASSISDALKLTVFLEQKLMALTKKAVEEQESMIDDLKPYEDKSQ